MYRGHTKYYGAYTWKRCPYSLYYWDEYLSQGYGGNSTNPNVSSITYSQVTEHTTYSGCMVMSNRAGIIGWQCPDDDCWYYINYGRRYFES